MIGLSIALCKDHKNSSIQMNVRCSEFGYLRNNVRENGTSKFQGHFEDDGCKRNKVT